MFKNNILSPQGIRRDRILDWIFNKRKGVLTLTVSMEPVKAILSMADVHDKSSHEMHKALEDSFMKHNQEQQKKYLQDLAEYENQILEYNQLSRTEKKFKTKPTKPEEPKLIKTTFPEIYFKTEGGRRAFFKAYFLFEFLINNLGNIGGFQEKDFMQSLQYGSENVATSNIQNIRRRLEYEHILYTNTSDHYKNLHKGSTIHKRFSYVFHPYESIGDPIDGTTQINYQLTGSVKNLVEIAAALKGDGQEKMFNEESLQSFFESNSKLFFQQYNSKIFQDSCSLNFQEDSNLDNNFFQDINSDYNFQDKELSSSSHNFNDIIKRLNKLQDSIEKLASPQKKPSKSRTRSKGELRNSQAPCRDVAGDNRCNLGDKTQIINGISQSLKSANNFELEGNKLKNNDIAESLKNAEICVNNQVDLRIYVPPYQMLTMAEQSNYDLINKGHLNKLNLFLKRSNEDAKLTNNTRLSHPFHTLPRVYRKSLTLEGSPLKEVMDVSNCYYTLMYKAMQLSDKIKDDELMKYEKIVRSGKFYETVSEFVHIAPSEVRDDENYGEVEYLSFIGKTKRDLVKLWLQSYRNFMSEGQAAYNHHNINKFYKKEFPSIQEWLFNYPKVENADGKIVKRLQSDMCKIETYIISRVALKLASLGVIPFTLHDAIYLSQKHIDFLKDKLNLTTDAGVTEYVNSLFWIEFDDFEPRKVKELLDGNYCIIEIPFSEVSHCEERIVSQKRERYKEIQKKKLQYTSIKSSNAREDQTSVALF